LTRRGLDAIVGPSSLFKRCRPGLPEQQKEEEMGVFHFIWYLVVGFFAGLIAKMVMHFHLGLFATIVLGIAGSLIGGFIGGLIWKPRDARFHPAGIILSVIGAILLLFVWKRFG
jgi:uncharacterized membrane protein YeaQ/YmgE (transglycosylase-associated protein family)